VIARLAAIRPRLIGFAVAATCGVLPLSLTACDPCVGVAHCAASQPYLAATGQIVDKVTGAGVDGARIDVVRTGGIAIAEDSLSATTRAGGFWRVEFATTSEGSVTVDVNVRPPDAPAYRVRGLAITARPHGGDANLNVTWVTRPYFNYVGELFRRGTIDQRIEDRPVAFRLTGGVATVGSGVSDSVYVASTDVAGRFELFPQRENGGLLPLGADDLVGDITVDLGPPLGPTVIRDVRLSPSYMYFDVGRIARFAVGP
jgi:hypothetical protein